MQTVICQVPVQGGLHLSGDAYLPDGQGPWPVIIFRTPYGKWQMKQMGAALTARGYAFFAQDVRGTGESAGTFRLFVDEPADAVTTGRWLLEQPWCDGRLAILGLSYCAGAAIAIATELPEAVKACIWVTVPVCRDLLVWQGGAMRLHHTLPWTLLLGTDPPLKNRDWAAFYRTLPLAMAAPDAPLWQLFCAHEEPGDPFWQAVDMGAYLDRVRAPGLHAGGWYDFVLDSTLVPYRRIAANRGAPQHLLVGPWSHNGILQAPEFQNAMAAFLSHWLKGEHDDLPPARICLTGEGGGWRDLEGWPVPGAAQRMLYLAPGRRLAGYRPGEGQESFSSDPLDPVPTQGGALWEFPQAGLNPGPAVQTTHGRPDVLTYDTDPLTAPLTICGPVTLELDAAASSQDADFTAKLCDVAPDGVSRIICDGILRARYRDGLDHSAPLVPGERYRLRIHMDCGHVLPPGHRLRLEVAGGNFPRFDRNLHTGGSQLRTGEADVVTALETVHLGLSRLILPVLAEG